MPRLASCTSLRLPLARVRTTLPFAVCVSWLPTGAGRPPAVAPALPGVGPRLPPPTVGAVLPPAALPEVEPRPALPVVGAVLPAPGLLVVGLWLVLVVEPRLAPPVVGARLAPLVVGPWLAPLVVGPWLAPLALGAWLAEPPAGLDGAAAAGLAGAAAGLAGAAAGLAGAGAGAEDFFLVSSAFAVRQAEPRITKTIAR